MKKNITIKDIAREAGVSTATVSRVLSNKGYASDDIRKKVLAVAKQLNYRQNSIAKSLKMHKTNLIGVIIPDISNPYFMKISKGIEDVVQEKGYNLLFMSGDENPHKEEKQLKLLLEHRVDAIIIATSGKNDELISSIHENDTPVILIDRKLEAGNEKMDFVVENNFEGAYQLTSYLIRQKHKLIGVVNGSLNVSTGVERFSGYKKAMEDYAIVQRDELIFNGDFSVEDGRKAIDYFMGLDQRPTAVLSFNNTMSTGVILQLDKLGLTIPDDMFLASYGETEVAQLINPKGKISVKQSPYKMGVKVGEIILDRLVLHVTGPTQEVFNPQLEK
ncbi:LacI family DNA-binding transcriptional regulator [Gracilibacillus alcaliphilus]|uniref:LacI family DNA-binding transcriptional regulator n=1 Tax=Gracilibacillus alcaliphilus TaxID=1401441 RepID=UPI00195BD581|nr:LacI family DNA-binding transcriptional regulator [Gracilibacillus alcaliphilus]MBM7675685.1 LacI family transcriptional regulator [Gracilibacillus alcaliphilus]